MTSSKEVVFDLDAAAFSSDEFRMYQFKVKRCPRARPHDWTQCPFAHPGEKAKRRDPRRYRYSGTACPEFRRNGCCRRGDACPFAHGVFECWLHPSRYRTQMCTDGTSCKRRVCFFAHTDNELRKPEEDPVWLQQQLQAELAAEQQVQQQLQALKVFNNLLGGQGQNATSNTAGAELLKALPASSLAALLGNASESSQGQQPQQNVAADDKLKALVQQLLSSGGNQANAPAALQLLGLLDKQSQQQPSQPQVAAQQQTSQQQQQHNQLAALASALLGGADSPGLDSSSPGQDLQLKLAQQLLQVQDPVQNRLSQLQKAVEQQNKPTIAVDVLGLLAGMQQERQAPASAPQTQQLAAVLQQLGLSQGLDGASMNMADGAGQNGSADPMASLAAALFSGLAAAPSPAPRAVTSEPVDSYQNPQQPSLDNAIAALLQQSNFINTASQQANSQPSSASQVNLGNTLSSLLSQLQVSNNTRAGQAQGPSISAADEPAPAPKTMEDLRSVHDQVASTKEQHTGLSNILGGDQQALMTLFAEMTNKPTSSSHEVLRNVKMLFESMQLLKGDNGASLAGGSFGGADDAINRSTSFDKILADLPRSLSEAYGLPEAAGKS